MNLDAVPLLLNLLGDFNRLNLLVCNKNVYAKMQTHMTWPFSNALDCIIKLHAVNRIGMILQRRRRFLQNHKMKPHHQG